jgi:hypothetical protein
MVRAYLLVLLVAPLLAGCVVASVARTAVDVVSVPVKVVGKGIDAALPTQKRADEKRGRELRRLDEQRAIDERCQQGRPLRTDHCAPQSQVPPR